ncbi:MAG TPA: diheme cytochrome c [Gammaproteobacteria bacterium]|nr:diheme cytochrome c [Gammaproteobacteria bacterium]
MSIVSLLTRRAPPGLVGALLALGTSAAHADDEIFPATDPTWKAECGACHVAYPPALLPAESWRTLMAELDRHFGTDASLDAATTEAIAAFLERNAGRARSNAAASPPLRITETRWFLHEHDEIPARVWNSDAVQRGVNCEACHTRAADGNFDERTRSVPR